MRFAGPGSTFLILRNPGKGGSADIRLPRRAQSAADGVCVGPDSFLAGESRLELDVVGHCQLISRNVDAGAGSKDGALAVANAA